MVSPADVLPVDYLSYFYLVWQFLFQISLLLAFFTTCHVLNIVRNPMSNSL
jgi:hypothetical protein